MQALRLTLVSVVLAVATAACAGSASTASTHPSVTPPESSPSAAPVLTAATPLASPVAVLAKVIAPTISLYEWKVIVADTIKAGPSTFTISNFGTVPHELLIFKSDLAPTAYPKDKTGHIIEDGPGIKLLSDGENIDPAGVQTRTIDLKPGSYLFVCNIPGHFMQGMFQVVTVVK